MCNTQLLHKWKRMFVLSNSTSKVSYDASLIYDKQTPFTNGHSLELIWITWVGEEKICSWNAETEMKEI